MRNFFAQDLWIFILAATLTPCIKSAEPDPPPLLTSAAEVRSLNPAEAAQARPVRVRGTMLFTGAFRDALILHDAGEGLYVRTPTRLLEGLQPGDWLEIEGVSHPGNFAPIMEATKIVRLEHRKLPEPQRANLSEVAAGGLDAAWVQVEGIVRRCTPLPDAQMLFTENAPPPPSSRPRTQLWRIDLAQGDTQLKILILGCNSPLENLVDARVSMRGVAFNVHNASRQFVRAQLHVADATMIHVLVPAPPAPFSLTPMRAEKVSRFSREGFTGHRVRVRGIVTALHAGTNLWLRDGGHGLSVESSQTMDLSPGDEVDIIGFPKHGGYAPRLEDAEIRRVAGGPPPEPFTLTNPASIAAHESDLVQIDAEITAIRVEQRELHLTLRWQNRAVAARLPSPPGMTPPDEWQPSASIRATGICLLAQDDGPDARGGLWVADDLQLLLRTPDDIVMLRPAPWWTLRRKLVLTGAFAGAMALALVWVILRSRRQIARREQGRKRAEIEFAAMLQERNRLAREIHDTVAQNLNAVSIQLELARHQLRNGPDHDAPTHIDTAHRILRHTTAEVRESIWNMRSHILEKTDLTGALRTVVGLLGSASTCAISVRDEGNPRRLASVTENNLLRIGQEAVANALKHSRATTIDLVVSFEHRAVRLRIRDNGCGFTPTAPHSEEHIGLHSMKERALQLNAPLQISSAPDAGTTIEILVPLPD